ncbi:MAG: sulfite exporter TauE/SafE family protein [Polyangiaceae bacterium]
MSAVAIATSAFVAGLLGSLHCTGMCGPLAVAGCSKGRGLVDGPSGYFAGRLVAYATLGAVVAHLGKHAFCILPMNAAHAIAVGLTALPAAARGVSLLARKQSSDFVPLRKKPQPSRILTTLAAVLPRRGLGLGLATGILPCGLLITAFAMAAATASPMFGAMSMAAFAIGSAPGLLIPLVGRGVAERLKLRIPPKIEGLMWCALAVWLGVRLAMGESCHTGMAMG